MTLEEKVITAGVWFFTVPVLKTVFTEIVALKKTEKHAIESQKALGAEQLQRNLRQVQADLKYQSVCKVANLQRDRAIERRRWEFRFSEAQGVKEWRRRSEIIRAWAGDQVEEFV